VIALVVVVIDESADMSFKITRQKVVFQQNAVIQCLMPTLNLALNMRPPVPETLLEKPKINVRI